MNSQGPEVTEHVSGRCHSHEKDRPLWALFLLVLARSFPEGRRITDAKNRVTKHLQHSEIFQESPKPFLINPILPENPHAI